MSLHRFVILALALLVPQLGFAAPSVLQANYRGDSGNQTSVDVTDMPDTLTSGSTLIAALSCENPAISAVSVSDTKNGTYTLDASSGTLAGNSGAGGGIIEFFHVANTYGGTGSGFGITASWTTEALCVLSVYEVAGLAASPFDTTGTAKTGTGSLTSLDYSITPSNSNEFVVAVGLSGGATGIAVDSGYTFVTSDQGSGAMPFGGDVDYHSHEYAASVSGTQSLTLHGTSATGASMFAAAYKAAGASGPPKSQMFFGAFNLATPEWPALSDALGARFSAAGRTQAPLLPGSP